MRIVVVFVLALVGCANRPAHVLVVADDVPPAFWDGLSELENAAGCQLFEVRVSDVGGGFPSRGKATVRVIPEGELTPPGAATDWRRGAFQVRGEAWVPPVGWAHELASHVLRLGHRDEPGLLHGNADSFKISDEDVERLQKLCRSWEGGAT